MRQEIVVHLGTAPGPHQSFHLSGCRVVRTSPSPQKTSGDLFFLLFSIFKQTSNVPILCCCQQNKSTQNDEIAPQRHSWWHPSSSCAERVRETKPKQLTQEPTQASLTAAKFVVLVDFQTVCASLKNVRKYSVREKSPPPKKKDQKSDDVNEEINGLVIWSAALSTVTRCSSNSQSVIKLSKITLPQQKYRKKR